MKALQFFWKQTMLLRRSLDAFAANNRITSFVICNDGFTIERLIHGMEADYNNIVNWNYKDIVTVFGATDQQARKLEARTKDELNTLLGNEEFNSCPVLQFVEVYMPKESAPKGLVKTAEASAKRNAQSE